jgi:hypothetical protein
VKDPEEVAVNVLQIMLLLNQDLLLFGILRSSLSSRHPSLPDYFGTGTMTVLKNGDGVHQC